MPFFLHKCLMKTKTHTLQRKGIFLLHIHRSNFIIFSLGQNFPWNENFCVIRFTDLWCTNSILFFFFHKCSMKTKTNIKRLGVFSCFSFDYPHTLMRMTNKRISTQTSKDWNPSHIIGMQVNIMKWCIKKRTN